ncbi:MAG: sugar transferase [Gemmatimonadetes bacterium]|nr:MAG: sugar transferase [Gemmatimonadota bacterium]
MHDATFSPLIRFFRRFTLPIFLLVDAICINLSFSLAIYIFSGVPHLQPFWGWGQTHITIAGVCTVVWLVAFYGSELYTRNLFSFAQALRSATLAFVFITVITYFLGRRYAYPRTVFLLTWFFITCSVGGWRLLVRLLLWDTFGSKLIYKTTALVGATSEGEIIAREIQSYPDTEHRLIGFVDDHQPAGTLIGGLPVLGTRAELNQLIERYYIDEFIIVRSSHQSYKDILALINTCEYPHVSFKVSPDPDEILLVNPDMRSGDSIPLVEAMTGPIQGWQYQIKRVIDIMGALTGLLLFLPFFPLVVTLIKLSSPGPIFYLQERTGKGGKPFRLIKFRSMIADAEAHTGPVWAAEDDPRITPWGRFMRRTSIDEIPQLINILKGDMSLVGPRPERPYFVQQHPELQGIRLSVLPGLTGLSQVNGRYLQTIQERVKFDYYYIRNYSLWLDVEIIFRTIWVVLTQKGAI